MSKLHLVFGGRVSDPRTLDFTDLSNFEAIWTETHFVRYFFNSLLITILPPVLAICDFSQNSQAIKGFTLSYTNKKWFRDADTSRLHFFCESPFEPFCMKTLGEIDSIDRVGSFVHYPVIQAFTIIYPLFVQYPLLPIN